jgi:hypothetical protein
MNRTAGAVLAGTVRDPDGRPVSGARVFITAAPVPMPEIAALTDAAGRFRIAAPAPGRYDLEADSDDTGLGVATASALVPGSFAAARGAPPPGRLGAEPDFDPDEEMSNDAPASPARTATAEGTEVIVVELRFALGGAA